MADARQGCRRPRRSSGGRAFIGISGWLYPAWRGVFYPAGLPQRRELEHAAARFRSIEVNGTFYSLIRPETFEAWHDQTPGDFVFALKGSRYLTHLLRLTKLDAPLANFFASGPLRLGAKLGPILWQFPQRFAFDAERLEAFFAKLPRTHGEASRLAMHHDDRLLGRAVTASRCSPDVAIRHAIEPRHESFFSEELSALCAKWSVAVVLADTAGVFPAIDRDTADFRYLRLHGASELYVSGYSRGELERWAALIDSWRSVGRDVYAYFDNDVQVRAPFDALDLAALLEGHDPSSERPTALDEVTTAARTTWPSWAPRMQRR